MKNISDFVLFSSYKYFNMDDVDVFYKKNLDNQEDIVESLSIGFKNEIDVEFVKKNLGRNFIITTEEYNLGKKSLDFNDFKKLSLNLKIVQKQENNIIVKTVLRQSAEILLALVENPKIYRDNLFLFKMYPVDYN